MAHDNNTPPALSSPSDVSRRIAHAASTVRDGVVETLYPTRCAVCDQPGTLLCPQCAQKLTYIDYWRACPRCGGLWGRIQCTECNSVALKPFGLTEVPFDTCHNVLLYDAATKSIVSAYKDQGERRLATVIAHLMAQSVSPDIRERLDAVTYIPATRAALRRRDFDHGSLIAQELACELDSRLLPTLNRPKTQDQRALGKRDRRQNMRGAFTVTKQAAPRVVGACLLLADDVMTTGSTLYDATLALRRAGAAQVHALTFAHA